MELLEESFEGVEGRDGLVDLLLEFVEVALFEFEGFGIGPEIAGLFPFGTQFFEQAEETVLGTGHGWSGVVGVGVEGWFGWGRLSVVSGLAGLAGVAGVVADPAGAAAGCSSA